MPTREAIVNTLIPKEVEKPLPVRVISTKTGPSPKPKTEPVGDQPDTSRSESLVVASTPPAESAKLSPQLSALARKEQAFRQRELAFKEREKSLESRLVEAEQYSKLKAKLSSKDYSELDTLGFNYDEYVQYRIDKQGGEDPHKLAIKKLEDEIEALKKGSEEKSTQEYEETVSEYRKEVNSLAESDPRFSSVKELKRQEAALQFILDSWEQDNEEITVEQALTIVEDYSVEEAKQFSSLSKLKLPVNEAELEKKLPPPKTGLKTLTQQVVASSEKKPAKNLQYLSESERYAEARRRVLERKQGN